MTSEPPTSDTPVDPTPQDTAPQDASPQESTTDSAAPAAETTAAAPSAETTPAATGDEAPAQKPVRKFNIGRKEGDAGGARKVKPKPMKGELQSRARSISQDKGTPIKQEKVPVPSKRKGAFWPELDQDMDAAFADVELGELIDGADAVQPSATLDVESRVKATVTKVHRDDVFFSLDGRNEGVASVRSFTEEPELGTAMEVIIRGYNREDGLYQVSVPGASVSVSDWSDIDEGAVVEAKVEKTNTGGLEASVNGIRAFIPAGQVSIYRVEDFEEYIGKKLLCVVTEANPQRKNLVLSHRALLEREQEEQRKQTLESLEIGETYDGVVRSLQDFGAFVDIGGVDGLVHISQLSWERVNHPSEVLKEGQTIQVKLEKIDPATGKIGLSYRETLEHPWDGIEENYPVNSIVTGTVTRIANFGAFVRITTGVEGLVHVSEIAHHRVTNVSSVLKEGQEVQVKILSIDRNEQRMSLSIKQTLQKPEGASEAKEVEEEPLREMALPKHEGPLKGGVERPSGGEQFGLKW